MTELSDRGEESGERRVDADLVRRLAAASGLELTTERAADLIPAVQVILDFDGRLRELRLDATTVAGLPWAAGQGLP